MALENFRGWKEHASVIRIVVIYAIVGGLWIFFSDTLLGWLTHDPDLIQRISIFKGIGFILFTSLLLYLLIHRHQRSMSAVNHWLRASSEHLQAIYEAMYEAVLVHDPATGKVLDVNQAMRDMFGYLHEEAFRLDVEDLIGNIPHQSNVEVRKRFDQAREGVSQQFDCHGKRKDGTVFNAFLTMRLVVIGGEDRIVTMVRDITDRVATENKISFFKSLVEYSRDPIYVLSPRDGYRMEYANQAACQHFGIPVERLRTMRIPDWDPTFDMSQLPGILEHLRQGKSMRFETMHRVASGKLIPVEVSANYLLHNNEEFAAGYFCDISERKTMESALRESEARYRSLSMEFQALLDAMPDCLMLLSPDLKILWANTAAARMLGTEKQNLIGRYCHEARHERNIPCNVCIAQETFASGEPRESITSSPKSLQIFESRTLPIIDEAGIVTKVIEVDRDITGQKAQEAERLELERQVLHAQKLESLGVLAGGIAHDFNNILAGIMGNLSLLRLKLPPEQASAKHITQCEKAVTQATRLTCQLLTFSRGGDPVKKLIDLGKTLEEAVAFALPGSNVAATLDIAEDLWPLQADEGQISQVVNNLLINAGQSMPQGGMVRVKAENASLRAHEVTFLEEGFYVLVRVIDQGRGIAPEDLPKIFDPYFTTKESGTGLGLTSAYSIVRKHAGDIVVSSEIGRGSTFEIYLPALPEHAGEDDTSATDTIVSGSGSVIVMDDEEMLREMTEGMLSMLGYDVESCGCGEELLEIYVRRLREGTPPDAVILDLTIPGKMGGQEAAAKILEFDPRARLIVASGYSTDPILANYRDYGFIAAVSKPFKVENLSHELAAALAETRR